MKSQYDPMLYPTVPTIGTRSLQCFVFIARKHV